MLGNYSEAACEKAFVVVALNDRNGRGAGTQPRHASAYSKPATLDLSPSSSRHADKMERWEDSVGITSPERIESGIGGIALPKGCSTM